MVEIIFLIFGLLGLWLGAEITIRGATDLAKHYKISRAFLGLTILAVFPPEAAAVWDRRGNCGRS